MSRRPQQQTGDTSVASSALDHRLPPNLKTKFFPNMASWLDDTAAAEELLNGAVFAAAHTTVATFLGPFCKAVAPYIPSNNTSSATFHSIMDQMGTWISPVFGFLAIVSLVLGYANFREKHKITKQVSCVRYRVATTSTSMLAHAC